MSMATSIFHRISGNALAFGGLAVFAWWLAAAATSEQAYATFLAFLSGPLGWIIRIGLSWVLFQHLASGLRHLAMDSGWGYGLGVSRMTGTAVFVAGLGLTAAFWAGWFLLGHG